MITSIEDDEEQDRRIKKRRYKSCGESSVLTFEGYWIKETLIQGSARRMIENNEASGSIDQCFIFMLQLVLLLH